MDKRDGPAGIYWTTVVCLKANSEDVLLKCGKEAVKAAALTNTRGQQRVEKGREVKQLMTEDWKKVRQSKGLPTFCNNIWTHIS